jgi:hypothetical protein
MGITAGFTGPASYAAASARAASGGRFVPATRLAAASQSAAPGFGNWPPAMGHRMSAPPANVHGELCAAAEPGPADLDVLDDALNVVGGLGEWNSLDPFLHAAEQFVVI